jgi:hypothetical protein
MEINKHVERLRTIRNNNVKNRILIMENARERIGEAYQLNGEKIEELMEDIFTNIEPVWAYSLSEKLYEILDRICYRGRPSKAKVKVLEFLRKQDPNVICQGIRDFYDDSSFFKARKKPEVRQFLGYVNRSRTMYEHDKKSIGKYQLQMDYW